MCKINAIKAYLFTTIFALFGLTFMVGANAGCADDREVSAPGAGVNTGTGGDDTSTTTDTGGTSTTTDTSTTTTTDDDDDDVDGDLPGVSMRGPWQVFSYDVSDSDPYDTFEFYADKADNLKHCAQDTECMEEAWDDSPGRPFQFLTTGSYSESFQGWLKGFCVLQYANSCGPTVSMEAGENCEDSNGNNRICEVKGYAEVSDVESGSSWLYLGEEGVSHTVYVSFNEGDECDPVVSCFGAEHGIIFDAGTYDTMSYNPENLVANNSKGVKLDKQLAMQ